MKTTLSSTETTQPSGFTASNMPLALVGPTVFIATNRPTQTSGTSWAGYPCLPLNTALRSSACCLNGFSSATVLPFDCLRVSYPYRPDPCPSSAIFAALRMLLISQLSQTREEHDLRRTQRDHPAR